MENETLRISLTFLGSSFFWMISIATTIGIILSFSKARDFEGAGASKLGSVFIYILVASIGMKMDLTMIFDNVGLVAIGIVWMLIHATFINCCCQINKSSLFLPRCRKSKANVGGAASAPSCCMAAFHPSLSTCWSAFSPFSDML